MSEQQNTFIRLWERVDDIASLVVEVKESVVRQEASLSAYVEMTLVRFESAKTEMDQLRQRTLENRTDERKAMGAVEAKVGSLEASRSRVLGFALGLALGAGGLGGAVGSVLARAMS